ncbi:MAG: hypothetical protein ACM3SS_20020 [Rhodospirillaceae bacterium]
MDLTYVAVWIGLPLLAGYIAHRKARSVVGAVVLTAIAPPIGILTVLLVGPHPSSGQRSNTNAKLLIGLLPLWAAIAVVAIGGHVSKSPDYWNVAPWLIIAALPVCIVTLVLVEVFSRKVP